MTTGAAVVDTGAVVAATDADDTLHGPASTGAPGASGQPTVLILPMAIEAARLSGPSGPRAEAAVNRTGCRNRFDFKVYTASGGGGCPS